MCNRISSLQFLQQNHYRSMSDYAEILNRTKRPQSPEAIFSLIKPFKLYAILLRESCYFLEILCVYNIAGTTLFCTEFAVALKMADEIYPSRQPRLGHYFAFSWRGNSLFFETNRGWGRNSGTVAQLHSERILHWNFATNSMPILIY